MPGTNTSRLEGLTTSVAVKAPCRVATTAVITLSGLRTIDDVALAANDRVLVKDQADTRQNGIYLAQVNEWTRALDFDGTRDAVDGTYVFVTDGTTQQNTNWRVSATNPVRIGTSAIVWELASPGQGSAGDDSAFRPETYGAIGDGVTNDTAAFTALSAAFNLADGGVIEFASNAVYIVGNQRLVNDGTYMFKGDRLLYIANCTKPVDIRGNGATMKLIAGYKFGTFNSSGVPTSHSLPYTSPGEKSSIMHGDTEGILTLDQCLGSVRISDLTLDGNEVNAVLGGQFGDGGYQLPGDGLILYFNSGRVIVENVDSIGCPRDGCLAAKPNVGPQDVWPETLIRNCSFDANGRQGVSLISGTDYVFDQCNFLNTNQGQIESAPGAGVDLEAEGGHYIRRVSFRDCLWSNNGGVGMVSDSGNVAEVDFLNCRFIGEQNWALWIAKKYFTFRKCTVVGATVFAAISGLDPGEMPKFYNCHLTDDPAYSPSGVVGSPGPAINSGGASLTGLLYQDCLLDYGHTFATGGANDVLFRDTTINTNVAHGAGSMLIPRFEGDCFVTGDYFGLYSFTGPVVRGTLTVDGVRQYAGSKTYDPGNIVDGAKDTTTITCPGARLGDQVFASFTIDLAGVSLRGAVTSANTVTAYFENETAGDVNLASGTLSAEVTPARRI